MYEDFFEKDELLTDKRKIFDTCTYSFLWLKEYGYIKCGNEEIRAERMIMVSLTEKSLTILNCIPSSLKQEITLAQKLSNAAKSGSKELITESIRQIVQCGFKLIPTII